ALLLLEPVDLAALLLGRALLADHQPRTCGLARGGSLFAQTDALRSLLIEQLRLGRAPAGHGDGAYHHGTIIESLADSQLVAYSGLRAGFPALVGVMLVAAAHGGLGQATGLEKARRAEPFIEARFAVFSH